MAWMKDILRKCTERGKLVIDAFSGTLSDAKALSAPLSNGTFIDNVNP